MMWPRLLLTGIPVLSLAGLGALFHGLMEVRPNLDDRLVVGVERVPGLIDPLTPVSGVEREVTHLVFDRLFRRDDDLLLRGHLAEDWESRERVSWFFAQEGGAEAALEALQAVQAERWQNWGVLSVEREGEVLRLWLRTHRSAVIREVEELFGEEPALEPVHHLTVRTRDAARESLRDFLDDALEAPRVRLAWHPDARRARLRVSGDPQPLLREMRAYYDSNPALQAEFDLSPDAEPNLIEPELVIRLRDGLRWHDGERLGAEDVVFSYREAMRAGEGTILRERFEAVIGLEVLEERVLRVSLHEPYAPLLESLELLPILPAHVLADRRTQIARDGFLYQPVGSGPYQVLPRRGGDLLELVANPGYFLGAPEQPGLSYREVGGAADRALALQLGMVDTLYFEAGERVLPLFGDRFQRVEDVSRLQTFVAWNLRQPLFQDARVRRALALLVRRDAASGAPVGSRGRPVRGLFYPRIWYHPEDASAPLEDRVQARALLGEAGWRFDGTRWLDMTGEPVAFELVVDAGDPSYRQLVEGLVASWRAEGIDVSIESRPWPELLTMHLASREFDAVMLRWTLGYHRDQYRVWHSEEAGPGGGNFTGLRNQEVDQLVEGLRQEEGTEQVRTLAASLQEAIWDLQPCLFLDELAASNLVRHDAIEVVRPRLDGERRREALSVPPAGIAASRAWWVKPVAAPEPVPGAETAVGGAGQPTAP